MIKDPSAKRTFPNPPMIAYRQPPNLRRTLVHAKKPIKRPKRIVPGFVRCKNNSCKVCPYVVNSKNINSTTNNFQHKITGEFTCNTKGVIYILTCDKCNKQYVGQTIRRFSDRVKEHMTSVEKKDKTMGTHYLLPHHSKAYFRAQIIEKVSPCTPLYLTEREDFWIRTLDTKTPKGINIYN